MLDTDTKRRIDTCRDILVGKVPDPKSQVEQITIALIYKFMDDMDAESEAMGGRRGFFTDEFAQYRWSELMAPGMGGFDTLTRYSEALSRMNENPGIPPLFRDIFKNAYLPYRDPETLRGFLKEIDGFHYDHSERLGDAFEYLLSVLGSQGDAGQFRTPRHIIDFIVAIVDPKKDETILDPACGTAGFLISAWKHIRAANAKDRPGDRLTPAERRQLADAIQGYDISPDMARLSLVNLYLHGFADPRIHEYDTLTSEDRWNEYFDVILANPPFMSPKGGIKPHKRFSVQSKRSEVLFVDYMAEHLTPRGRAGIIVPEGIIFQSQTAYKQLRRMLVEKYLVAVISLPAGCFNPYSGVKTSILILDRQLAKRTDEVLFVKVENDGFGLGARRRRIEKDDLPEALKGVKAFLADQENGEGEIRNYELQIKSCHERLEGREKLAERKGVLLVSRKRIGESGEWNLSGERYRESNKRASRYPVVPLGDVCNLVRGVTYSKTDEVEQGGHQLLRANNIDKLTGLLDLTDIKRVSSILTFSGDKKLQKGDIFICLASGSKAHIGKVALIIVDTDFYFGGFMGAVRTKRERLHPAYLFHQLRQAHFNDFLREQIAGANINNLGAKLLYEFQIPLPPLAVQQEIVAEIEGYQKIIDGARQVIENYRPHIHMEPEWPVVALKEVCERIQYGLSNPLHENGMGYKTFRMNELIEGYCVDQQNMKFSDISPEDFKKYRLERGDILFNRTNSFEHVGRTGIFDLEGDYCFASYLIRLSVAKEKASPFFVNAFMNSKSFQQGIKQFASRAIGQSNINAKNLAAYRIPLPPLPTQQAIVAEIREEQRLVEANRELIRRFEAKIEQTIDRVWGD
uniref:site-specific DNA-methyltransferase (adenine-specific) n=1 Tax=Candidatus Kentrum eta TaxID=2126337 RepID=A0A450U713_9GAMM|nr:MAG: type I restriction enzyme M protein [Candidatus Kentron sp. H]VFJ89045.1 MAG: type I restriction enzyme M protein [Candidatus Kentron sp. H]VFJ95744.1 MAG: type I restriction enzyme M protein [Candidatus Kentron sp. H]